MCAPRSSQCMEQGAPPQPLWTFSRRSRQVNAPSLRDRHRCVFQVVPLNEIPASPADRSASGEELAFGATPPSLSKACVPSGSSDTLASLLQSNLCRSAAIRLGGLNFGNGARAHVPSE